MFFSIRTRLYGGFFILLTCLLLSSLLAAGMLNILNERINRLIKRDVEKVRLVNLLDRAVLDISRLERNIILSENRDELLMFAQQITQTHGDLQHALDGLRTLAANDREIDILGQVTAAIAELIAVDRNIQYFGMLNSNVRALQLTESQGRVALNLAEESLKKLLTLEFRNKDGIAAIVQGIQLLLMTMYKDELHMILTTDDARMMQDGRDLELHEKIVFQQRAVLERLLAQEHIDHDLDSFDAHLQTYLETSRQVRTLTLENGNNKAIRLSREQGVPILFRVRNLLQALSASSEEMMLDAERQSDRDFVWVSGILFVLLSFSCVVGTFIALRIARDVNRGLGRAITAVEAVARGNLGHEDPVASGAIRDEFSQLMQSIERMVAAERHVVDAVKKLAVGDLNISLVERSEHDELIRSLNVLVSATHYAANVAKKLAIGDLDVEIHPRSDEDHLLHSLKNLVRAEHQVADMAQSLAREDVLVTVEERSPSDRLLNAMKDLAGVLRERAELRRMLMVAEKMSTIGQFAVRVAHEINNPLSTAAMGLQNIRFLMAPETLNPEVAHRLNQVENNIGRATHAARQMMEYSWTGQLEFDFFDLKDELNEMIDLVQADARPFDVLMEVPETIRIWGDRMKIGQVLRNLMQNALDASSGPCKIHVHARLEGDDRLLLSIRDWGTGIPPGLESKIFEPFFTTKKSGIGVGLGLPICYSIIRQLGGFLNVANAPGGGAMATLRLPMVPRVREG
ncbi:MAG: MCP four helix bundle domain-containing protein [Magnetococcales bacterium]|nr:MCP four helix bundle domain-containing protein [Magnetococcales bacterium]